MDSRTPTDPAASLFVALYGELRRLAERQLHRQPGVGVSPTTLLHEAYLEMAGRELHFPDRQRFVAYAARVMRGLLIDLVRERLALKNGGAFHITRLPTTQREALPDQQQLVRLSDALDALASHSARLAQIVDLKYFCGFTFEQIAAQLELSERTVQRDWEKARMLLFMHLDGET